MAHRHRDSATRTGAAASARPVGIGLGGAVALAVAACSGASEAPEGTAVAHFSYPPASHRAECDGKRGKAGATDGLSSRDGTYYNVRAPANLEPAYPHPLLMVYAPAGHSAARSEALTRLTTSATGRGFIVAYVGSRPLSQPAIAALARIPDEVAASWCIDPRRVYATGHSDGGTVSTALALLKDTAGTVTAIAPSAAGFSGKDLESFQCPAPLPVMIMHGRKDTHFPGWGEAAARWWARCNSCDVAMPSSPADDGCVAFSGCAPGGQTLYCEGTGTHLDWPPLQDRIVRFFEAAASP